MLKKCLVKFTRLFLISFFLSFSLATGIFILICTEMPYQPFHCYIARSYNNVPCPGNPGEFTAGQIAPIHSQYQQIS